MNDKNDQAWKHFVRAAKQAGAAGTSAPASSEEAAAERFVGRMRSLRGQLWAMAKAVFWRRWSLAALLVALALYGLSQWLLAPAPPRSIPTPHPPNPLAR